MVSKFKKRLGTLTIILSVPLVSIQCSDVGFSAGSEASKANPPTTGVDITSINEGCENGNLQEKTIFVNFPNPGTQCEWSTRENLETRNAYFQAERSQAKNLELPANAILCDAEFEFARDEEFWFDDVFILSLNDNILASSYNFDDYLSEENGFFRLNWENLAGKFWDEDNKSDQYCVGKAEGLSTCVFPAQHEIKPMELSISPEVIRTAMLNSRSQDHQVKLTILGDNDSSDCQHYDMSFAMRVKYID